MTVKLMITLFESGKGPRNFLSSLESGDRLLIGRGQNVQLWINDKNISREHCEIICENDNIYIYDKKSRNGTYINGKRITKKVLLKDGDEVRLASTSWFNIYFQKEKKKKEEKREIIITNFKIDKVRNVKKYEEPTLKDIKQIESNIFIPKNFSLVGKEFNGYFIEEMIGAGGMAVVYKAKHLALNRYVAIKTLAKRLLQNPRAIKRFLNVAKISGQLRHPNIVQIYDSGKLDEYGIYYIVMEYVEGESLNNILEKEGKLEIERACNIISYIASALTYAKKKNIIHRDINPSNILVGEEDVPKLIGLGLAKCLDDEMTALTQPGKGMGMIGYIAPEQLLDATKADHRSDIYSLGAVLYRCVCGKPPYDTKNMREYFNCIYNKIPPIPPHELNPKVPRAINDLILKALSYEPKDRFQSAEEFLEELKSFTSPNIEESIKKAKKQLIAMFPSKESVEGFEFESIYKPLHEIGGDFYDFIHFNEDEFAIIIGDITGHGLEAAVVVGMVKMAIKIIGKQCKDPVETMRRVNKEIYPDLDKATFATVFYGIINKRTKILRFCRAGHTPLIIYNPNKEPKLKLLEPKGMVLGMFSKCECKEEVVQLESGDCLIQYTDGIIEAKNIDEEEFGIDRLKEVIEESGKNGDIKEIIEGIEDAVRKFIGAEEQQDDITIIGIKIK